MPPRLAGLFNIQLRRSDMLIVIEKQGVSSSVGATPKSWKRYSTPFYTNKKRGG